MTQLDRLEALAEGERAKDTLFVPLTHEELADLIRVARAAKNFLDDGLDLDGQELEIALAPLFSEVES